MEIYLILIAAMVVSGGIGFTLGVGKGIQHIIDLGKAITDLEKIGTPEAMESARQVKSQMQSLIVTVLKSRQ